MNCPRSARQAKERRKEAEIDGWMQENKSEHNARQTKERQKEAEIDGCVYVYKSEHLTGESAAANPSLEKSTRRRYLIGKKELRNKLGWDACRDEHLTSSGKKEQLAKMHEKSKYVIFHGGNIHK